MYQHAASAHLVLGTGCAWAGQSRQSMLPALLLMRSPSVFTENLGRELPTGSMKRNTVDHVGLFPATTYLNDGTGDPWAGQSRPTAVAALWKTMSPIVFTENLGRELPTGSERMEPYVPGSASLT